MAWTISESIDQIANTELMGGKAMYRIKLACTADANATSHDISADTMDIIKGGFIYLVKTAPGSGGDAPTAVYDVSIKDSDGDALLTVEDRSTSAVEWETGSATIGVFPPILSQISVAVDDQIGNLNKATIYIYVGK